MGQNLLWLKAYLVSIALHLVIALLFAWGLAEVAAENEQRTYVVDLATGHGLRTGAGLRPSIGQPRLQGAVLDRGGAGDPRPRIPADRSCK